MATKPCGWSRGIHSRYDHVVVVLLRVGRFHLLQGDVSRGHSPPSNGPWRSARLTMCGPLCQRYCGRLSRGRRLGLQAAQSQHHCWKHYATPDL